MNNPIELLDIANMISSIADFKSHLLDRLLQPTGTIEQRKISTDFAEKFLRKKGYLTDDSYNRFNQIEIHFVQQLWGSTSAGWGGIGGSAMTTSYTLILENNQEGFAAVYYNGKLAYVIKTDIVYLKHRVENYRQMPGLDSVSKIFNVLYKSR